MKKKIILSVLFIILIFASFVYATETDQVAEVMPISTNNEIIDRDSFQAGDIVIVEDKTINGNVFYAGEKVKVSNVSIDGDVFLAAETIDFNGVTVNGSVFVAGKNITLLGCDLTGNLYSAGSNISLEETKVQDVFSASAIFELNGASNIERSLNAVSENILINSSKIQRNANLSVTNLNIGPETQITGGLFYSSEKQANIAEGAIIGSIDYNVLENIESSEIEYESNTMSDIVYNVVVILIKAIFVVGFIFLFGKGFIEKQKVKNIASHLGINAAQGLLWTVLLPIISILLMCTGVAVGLGFVVLAIYFIIFVISSSLVAISISTALTQKMEYNAWKFYGITILVALAIAILEQIPTIGGIITIFVGLVGMGLVVSGIKNKKVKKEEPEIV